MEVRKFREVKKYRKKPIVVEAVQYRDTFESYYEVINFTGDDVLHYLGVRLFISTPRGEMRVDNGDWVIRGVSGEFYPCKPDIFKLTYDVVEE